MQRFSISKKRLEISLIFALICALFVSMANFDAACEDMRDNILRLHIIANSDTEQDQTLKLKVRDEILKLSSEVFLENKTLDDAKLSAESALKQFNEAANKVIAENGYDYRATVDIGKAYFETREYDDFTLPAGEYDALIIKLGKAKGKNWWCVMFPNVCIPTCDGELSDTVKKESAKIAENPKKFVARFKIVEIYEEIKNKLKKQKNA